MTKTILIPTDFSIRLLKLVFRAIENNPNTKIDFILVHRANLSDSIFDLLFYSRKKILQSLENSEFRESCQIILSRYKTNIESFRVELFSGFNGNALQNLIEANQVDEVYRPLHYEMQLKDTRSLDIIPLLSKTKAKLVDIDMKSASRTITSEVEDLSDLFFQPMAKQNV